MNSFSEMKNYQLVRCKKNLFGRKRMNSDDFWMEAIPLTDFTSPWSHDTVPPLIFRGMYDNRNFYFRFDVIDNTIITDKITEGKRGVLGSDRVEIFFRSSPDMKPYYCLEMDPLGRVLDYRAEFHRKFEFEWNWRRITVRASFTLNGYRVWGSIPLSVLQEMDLIREGKMQAGLFRGKAIHKDGSSPGFQWFSWILPDSETPDFHIPSAFGELQF